MGFPRTFPKKLFVLHSHHKTSSVLLSCNYYLFSVIICIHTLLAFQCVSSEPSPIMAFPSESGSYSLFPNEDLRTGKKIRFEDDLNRERDRDRDQDRYRTGDRYRSYPIMFEDRLHRPGDYNFRTRDQGTGSYLDTLRTRGSRVYFDDDRHRYSSYERYPQPYNRNQYQEIHDYHRQTPSVLHRPLSPVISDQQNRPFHHHYRPDVSPGPSHSKLPVGAGDSDIRIHVYDPVSNSFGNPRNTGKIPDRSRPGNFIETGSPSPDLFINHEQYLEYHRKIALARELEFRKLQKALENKQSNEAPGSKKVLFASKQPFDITGLSPPDKSGEVDHSLGISMKPIDVDDIGKGQIITFTGQDGQVNFVGIKDPNSSDFKSPNDETRSDNIQNYSNRERSNDQGGGIGHVTIHSESSSSGSGGHVQGEEVESENAKSQVTQIPPQHQQPKNFIPKSGRQLTYQRPTVHLINNNTRTTTLAENGNSNDARKGGGADGGDNNSLRRSNRTDGTDFQLTSRKPVSQGLSSNSGGGQALPLVQADTNGFVPNVPQFRQFPGAERPRAVVQLGSKGEKSGLGTEVTKSRIKSNIASKVAIIKQQELKQRQKLKINNAHTIAKLENPNHAQLTKTTNTFKTNTLSSSLNNPSASIPKSNFRIPVLPVIDTTSKLSSTFLDNNDILGPNRNNDNNIEAEGDDDGHFTLINLHNDQVDIHDPHGDEEDVHVDDENQPHLSGPLSSYSSSDLEHGGDTLVYLGTSDALVNKTFQIPTAVLPPLPDALSNPAASSNFIKVVRVKNLQALPNYKTTFVPANNTNNGSSGTPGKLNPAAVTPEKTLSMFMAKRMDQKSTKTAILKSVPASYLLNSNSNSTNSLKSFNLTKLDDGLIETSEAGGNGTRVESGIRAAKVSVTHEMSVTKGVQIIEKVHAHVSHCPKLQAPAEIICDIHIRERHGHPKPQLTVGWRRKFYNSTQPDVLLVLNKTQVYEDEKKMQVEKEMLSNTTATTTTTTTTTSSSIIDDGAEEAKSESLEDFHDKFNVTLAPGISPMLRSVLLIRGVTAPDCGNYQCEVSDGFYTLTSETLLFLCH